MPFRQYHGREANMPLSWSEDVCRSALARRRLIGASCVADRVGRSRGGTELGGDLQLRTSDVRYGGRRMPTLRTGLRPAPARERGTSDANEWRNNADGCPLRGSGRIAVPGRTRRPRSTRDVRPTRDRLVGSTADTDVSGLTFWVEDITTIMDADGGGGPSPCRRATWRRRGTRFLCSASRPGVGVGVVRAEPRRARRPRHLASPD